MAFTWDETDLIDAGGTLDMTSLTVHQELVDAIVERFKAKAISEVAWPSTGFGAYAFYRGSGILGAMQNITQCFGGLNTTGFVRSHDDDGNKLSDPVFVSYYYGGGWQSVPERYPNGLQTALEIGQYIATGQRRTITSWPRIPDGGSLPIDWRDFGDAAYSFGTPQAGDIAGPWLIAAIRRVLPLMLWTDYSPGYKRRHAIAVDAETYAGESTEKDPPDPFATQLAELEGDWTLGGYCPYTFAQITQDHTSFIRAQTGRAKVRVQRLGDKLNCRADSYAVITGQNKQDVSELPTLPTGGGLSLFRSITIPDGQSQVDEDYFIPTTVPPNWDTGNTEYGWRVSTYYGDIGAALCLRYDVTGGFEYV